jgi:peroxiredoxin
MKKLILSMLLISLAIVTTVNAKDINDKDIPTFTLTTIDDNNITISETKEGFEIEKFKGHAVLLVLFGHRCPPCLKEIPEFIKLTDKYEENLSIIAIEAQEYPLTSLKEFAKEQKINYNIVAGVNHKDFISYIAKRAEYNQSIPLPLLISIDKNGDVQSVQAGQLSQGELEFLVDDLNE